MYCLEKPVECNASRLKERFCRLLLTWVLSCKTIVSRYYINTTTRNLFCSAYHKQHHKTWKHVWDADKYLRLFPKIWNDTWGVWGSTPPLPPEATLHMPFKTVNWRMSILRSYRRPEGAETVKLAQFFIHEINHYFLELCSWALNRSWYCP